MRRGPQRRAASKSAAVRARRGASSTHIIAASTPKSPSTARVASSAIARPSTLGRVGSGDGRLRLRRVEGGRGRQLRDRRTDGDPRENSTISTKSHRRPHEGSSCISNEPLRALDASAEREPPSKRVGMDGSPQRSKSGLDGDLTKEPRRVPDRANWQPALETSTMDPCARSRRGSKV